MIFDTQFCVLIVLPAQYHNDELYPVPGEQCEQ